MGKYTASDGKEFDTKREWRKYEMLLMYTFKEKTGETLPVKKPGDVNGQQFHMMNLTKCEAVVPIRRTWCRSTSVWIAKSFWGPLVKVFLFGTARGVRSMLPANNSD